MIVWTYRVIVVLAAPLLAYQWISPDAKGIIIGLACGLAVVAAERFFGNATPCGVAGIKLVDTSAIIDGRIVDICETHFISGALVVPRFIVNDLHALSESADQLKRARGRRGLDILARLQELKNAPLRILDKDLPEIKEVDAKAVRLAHDLGAQVITTDFNIHKLAVLEGVTVLNVNDLSTALKPVVLPGEGMSIFVMKDGKEKEQGVGYLDDGTMVVVEEGRRWIGKRVEVSVYSILQTSAGRMIFAKAKPDAKPQQVMQQPEH